jgi:hypothetical protein
MEVPGAPVNSDLAPSERLKRQHRGHQKIPHLVGQETQMLRP